MRKACFYAAIVIILASIDLAMPFVGLHSSGSSRDDAWQSSEVEVINNPKTPVPEPGKRQRLVFSEELTIGVSEGDENYMFGEVVLFNTDEKGNFYVTDWDSKRIQKYDSNGEYLRTIGRPGQGPGEFQNLTGVKFDKDGNFYVTDLVGNRISFFDTDGNYLRQISMPDTFENLFVNSKGCFIAHRTIRKEAEGGMAFKNVYGLFDENFELSSEFYSYEWGFKAPMAMDTTSRAKFLASILSSLAFHPNPVFTVGNNDITYFGFPEKYEIDIYSPEGNKIKSIMREYNPIKVDKKDKRYFEESQAKQFTRNRPKEYFEETIRHIKYPKFKPAYRNFALMENGWLLVIVEYRKDEYALCDLFNERGIYIGQFKADTPPEFFFFKNGKAYAVATVDDYKYVKRYNFEIQEY